jgi:hypothetical protein
MAKPSVNLNFRFDQLKAGNVHPTHRIGNGSAGDNLEHARMANALVTADEWG